MSIETKPRTTEKYDLPTHIKPQQRGFMNVYEQDGTERVPSVQVNIHQGDRRNGFQAQPHRGIYAFGPLSKNKSAFPLKMSRGMTRNADVASKSLVEQSALVPDMTKLVFSDEGIVFYQPDNGYTTLVKTADEEPQTSKIMALTGDAETHVGRYNPQMGDIIYIVRDRDAESFLTPPYEDDVATDRLRDEDVQFATFEVTSEQVEAMAAARQQAARNKASTDRRRVETAAKLGKLAGSHGATEAQVVANAPESYTVAEPPITAEPTEVEQTAPTVDPLDDHDSSELNGRAAAVVAAPAGAEASAPEVTSSSSQALARLRQAREGVSAESVLEHEESADTPNTPRNREDDTTPSFDDANNRLARAVARRTKLSIFATGKKREKLDRLIAATDKAYTRRAQVLEDIEVKEWQAENDNLSDAELADKLAIRHKERADRYEQQEYEEFRNIKALGKVSELHDTALERYAGLSRKKKILVNLGAVAVLGAGGAALGVAFGAGGAALMAGTKLYKSYAHNRAGLYGRREESDKLAIYAGDANEGVVKSRDQLREEAKRQRTQTRTERITNTDKVNRNTRIAMAVSAVALGAGVANHAGVFREAADHVSGWWNSLGRDATDVITAPDAHIDFPRTEVKTIPGPGHVEAPTAPVEMPKAGDFLTGNGGSMEFSPAGLQNAHEWLGNYQVKSGDTIWSLSERYLVARGIQNPSVYQIDAVKDSLLVDFQQRGFADANGWLTAGQSLKF